MPYPAHSTDYSVRTFVATQQARNNPACNFYATKLRQALAQIYALAPQRPVVCLLNFCRSGGFLEFFRNEAAVAQIGAESWPLFLAASSQANHDALVGGLWRSFFETLASPALSSTTLAQFLALAKFTYNRQCRYELNDITHTFAYTSIFENSFKPPRTQAESLRVTGNYNAALHRLIVGGPDASPDFAGTFR